MTSRPVALTLGIVATALLFWMVNPWVSVPAEIGGLVTAAFWVLSIALLVVLYVEGRSAAGSDQVEIEGPAAARFLFGNSRAAMLWLAVRLFVGFAWLEAGWHKATGTGWLDGGSALAGYWHNAVAVPATGHAAITYDWYRSFLDFLLSGHHETWFAPLVTFGELAVGLGLILGALTGIAAFFGALMNISYLLAGSASTNPVMFTFAIGLMFAWRVAGYYGLDRWLLPRLGTPWRPGIGFAGPGTDRPRALRPSGARQDDAQPS
jgi:thiosulfate dehydrogenase (quinone) large subunit